MCGSSVPKKYKNMNSNGPNLTIKFGSNGSTRKKGFSLTVKGM